MKFENCDGHFSSKEKKISPKDNKKSRKDATLLVEAMAFR